VNLFSLSKLIREEMSRTNDVVALFWKELPATKSVTADKYVAPDNNPNGVSSFVGWASTFNVVSGLLVSEQDRDKITP
jgi:hypothetical protein